MTGRDIELVRVALGMDQDFFADLICLTEAEVARVEAHKSLVVVLTHPGCAICETLLGKPIEEVKSLGDPIRTALADHGWVAAIALIWKGIPR